MKNWSLKNRDLKVQKFCLFLCFAVALHLKIWSRHISRLHYSDVIMTTIASLITSLAVVYSAVYSDADQRKHQSSASLAFVWGIHRDRWIPRTKGQLRGKCFHLMTSSCIWKIMPCVCIISISMCHQFQFYSNWLIYLIKKVLHKKHIFTWDWEFTFSEHLLIVFIICAFIYIHVKKGCGSHF